MFVLQCNWITIFTLFLLVATDTIYTTSFFKHKPITKFFLTLFEVLCYVFFLAKKWIETLFFFWLSKTSRTPRGCVDLKFIIST